MLPLHHTRLSRVWFRQLLLSGAITTPIMLQQITKRHDSATRLTLQGLDPES